MLGYRGSHHDAKRPSICFSLSSFLVLIVHAQGWQACLRPFTGNKYEFHGISQPEVSFKTNAIKTAAKGYRRLTFADGGSMDIEYPVYMMRGIVYTAMPRGECIGTAKFTDAANRLSCVMEFGKIECSTNPLLQRPDSLQGTINTFDMPLTSTSPPEQQVSMSSAFHDIQTCNDKSCSPCNSSNQNQKCQSMSMLSRRVGPSATLHHGGRCSMCQQESRTWWRAD